MDYIFLFACLCSRQLCYILSFLINFLFISYFIIRHQQMQERQQSFSIHSQKSPRPLSNSSSICKSVVFNINTTRTHRTLRKRNSQMYDSPHKNSIQAKYKQKQFKIHKSSLSPERKTIYWQSWMLPNFSMSQSYYSNTLPTLKSYAHCALLSDTNQIITENNSNIRLQMASLTKIMTAYTVIHLSNSFGLKLREIYIKIHKQSAYMEGTTACLHQGQQILAYDLLYGMLLPSGNDAAIALAQYFGKLISFKFASEQQKDDNTNLEKFQQMKEFYDNQYQRDSIKLFVFEMNKNAYQIGLTQTHFSNPTGLSNTNNYSTAKDLALLTSHCLKNHTLRSIFKRKIYVCQAKNQKMATVRQIQWKNTNKLLFQIRQCIGVKTGITPNAGPCLSTAFKVLGRQLVVIVLKSQGLQQRYTDSQNIYRYCRKKIKAF